MYCSKLQAFFAVCRRFGRPSRNRQNGPPIEKNCTHPDPSQRAGCSYNVPWNRCQPRSQPRQGCPAASPGKCRTVLRDGHFATQCCALLLNALLRMKGCVDLNPYSFILRRRRRTPEPSRRTRANGPNRSRPRRPGPGLRLQRRRPTFRASVRAPSAPRPAAYRRDAGRRRRQERTVAERCRSGRTGRSRKPLCALRTVGSNPTLSAKDGPLFVAEFL